MKIIIDAMGGDNAPKEIVRGAVDAQVEFGVEIVLVGREEEVKACLADCGAEDNATISVYNADDVIDMHDDPITATRSKPGSSMAVALKLLKEGRGDACISAGSTGALLTGATLEVKRIRGIRRAALAPVIPNGGKGFLLIDCGANVECTEEYLVQFAYMGSFYAEKIMGCSRPRVALLNIGAEETKGTELEKNTYALLKKASDEGHINFIGNVEGSAAFSGGADVLVADGYSGNIMLKTIEGTSRFLMKNIKAAIGSSVSGKLGGALLSGELRRIKDMMDASEVGGTALLGISRPVIKAHGGSNARAIRSAVKQAIAFADADVVGEIRSNIDLMKLHSET